MNNTDGKEGGEKKRSACESAERLSFQVTFTPQKRREVIYTGAISHPATINFPLFVYDKLLICFYQLNDANSMAVC